MKQTFDVNFYCNKSKASRKTGEAPIYLSIIINGKRELFALQQKCRPDEFERLLKSKADNPIKSYCTSILRKLDELKLEMLDNDEELTAFGLKKHFMRGGVKKNYTINDLFTEYLNLLKPRVGIDMIPDVYQKYVRSCNLFLECNGLLGNENLKTITQKEVMTMMNCASQQFKASTAAGYMAKIKTIMKYAFNNGKMDMYPFANIKVKRYTEGEIKYLTQDELDMIWKKKMPSIRMQQIKDVWLFQCYTGLSFVDMANLVPSDFKKNDKGQYYISKKRQKTGVEFTTVLLKDAELIAKKYEFNLPVKSNQKYNDYLKELADICGLTNEDGTPKKLHSHMARHTCAVYFLNHGVDIEVIAKIGGWTNTKMVRRYAKLLDQTVFTKIEQLDKNEFLEILMED